MNATEFQFIRQELQKTQKQMSELLGISLKAVQSFEQGWRSIPPYVERQALFLLALKIGTQERLAPCWEIMRCPPRMREICPAWEFKSGHLCWFINGTVCQGKPRGRWSEKMLLCRKCKVLASFMKHWAFVQDEEPFREEKENRQSVSKNGAHCQLIHYNWKYITEALWSNMLLS
jgi:DNA-binding XRE family transcriptional regulator